MSDIVKKLQLTTKEIVDKEFHVDFKGYDAQEVDEFLDLVQSDYREMLEHINSLEHKLATLEISFKKIQIERNNERAKLEIISQEHDELQKRGLSNADIITRISKLEGAVYEEPTKN